MYRFREKSIIETKREEGIGLLTYEMGLKKREGLGEYIEVVRGRNRWLPSRLGPPRLHLPNSTGTPYQPFKYTLVVQKVHVQDPTSTTPWTAAYSGVKRVCEMGGIHLVDFVEGIFILDLNVELPMRVDLFKDVVDSNTIRMDLLDVNVPGQARMWDA